MGDESMCSKSFRVRTKQRTKDLEALDQPDLASTGRSASQKSFSIKSQAAESDSALSRRIREAADRLLDLRRTEEGLLARLDSLTRSRHSELTLISRLLAM